MTTYEPQPDGGDGALFPISSPGVSPASPSASRVSKEERRMSGGYGQRWRRSSVPSVPNGSSSKTCPACANEDLPMFSPASVGLATEPAPDTSQLAKWGPHIHGIDCSRWPTPRASDADKGGRGDLIANLRTGAGSRRKYWRTPTGYGPGLPDVIGGRPNPEWLEWLMGFPAGWTELGPSETP